MNTPFIILLVCLILVLLVLLLKKEAPAAHAPHDSLEFRATSFQILRELQFFLVDSGIVLDENTQLKVSDDELFLLIKQEVPQGLLRKNIRSFLLKKELISYKSSHESVSFSEGTFNFVLQEESFEEVVALHAVPSVVDEEHKRYKITIS